MIGLDTNVAVRYLVQDDPDQSAVASAVIDELTETDPGYLSLVTVVELHWVLGPPDYLVVRVVGCSV